VAQRSATRKRTTSRTRPDDGEAIVIYVHGIGRHLPAKELKLEWDLALFGRDRGDATHMAYWSDILHPPGAKASKAAAAGGELDADTILAQADVDPDDDEAREFVEQMLRSYGVAPEGGASGPRKKVLPLPRFVREPISRAFVQQFIADTAAYFSDTKKRAAIRKRLQDVLPRSRAPVTIVAHSQGSIVAVEVLARTPGVNVVKLVTIGSPLGLQEVQDFLELEPRRTPFFRPACVERWDNFADPLDPVALDKGLAGDFIIRPGGTGGLNLGKAIVDEMIVNNRTFNLRGFNPHSAAGYLSHPKVRRSVYDATHFDSMARFVVARDVAEALAYRERHPVLIEVLEPGYPAVDETPAEREQREKAVGLSLQDRIRRAAEDLEALVARHAREQGVPANEARERVEASRIDPLRRFVAAHLDPDELRLVAAQHRKFNVYAVWRSTAKRKLLHRSRAVLQADAALESYHATGTRIRWAVLDTGARSDHPHFAGRIVSTWDCTKRGAPRKLDKDADRDGHGSHVAGIIAGRSESDGRIYSGVAPDAELVIYKVLNEQGEGEDAWIIKALDHIAEQNDNNAHLAIHGLNLSLGGPYDSTVYGCGFTPICQELRRLWRSGVAVVVACGNEGQLEVQTRDGDVEINTPMSIGDPANLEDCIAVGSVNADRPHLYGISAFSSRGPTSDGRLKPDVVAPGERIMSVNARFSGKQRLYRAESGTSMAAPHVSGLLAAFLSVRREYIGRPDEVKKILLDTCTDIGRDRHHQGRGIPNLMKMLLSV
jgi:subtilisin family serine protease/pimeloyl-ACP methyl ester carboxylesterase